MDEIADRASRIAGRRGGREQPLGLRDPVKAFAESGISDPRRLPVALVLAGGGARGAYQGGVAQYLAESGTPVEAISGASIGALNGAILAAAPSLTIGAERIVRAWTQVAQESGSPPSGDDRAVVTSTYAPGPALPRRLMDESGLDQLRNLGPRLTGPLFRPGFLDDLIRTWVDIDDLVRGTPLWISVFPAVNPSIGGLEAFLARKVVDGPNRAHIHPRFGWMLDVVRAKVLGMKSEWLKVNELAREAIYDTLLGSAALPVVLPPRVVGGKTYRDGGFADNLPVGALRDNVSVRRVVVVHLQPYPLFNEGEFPELDIVEVIPSRPISPSGPLGQVSGLVDLSPRRVSALFELGYNDAAEQLGRLWRSEGIARIAEFAEDFRRAAVQELDEPPEASRGR